MVPRGYLVDPYVTCIEMSLYFQSLFCFSGDLLFWAFLKGLLGIMFYFSRFLKQVLILEVGKSKEVENGKIFTACDAMEMMMLVLFERPSEKVKQSLQAGWRRNEQQLELDGLLWTFCSHGRCHTGSLPNEQMSPRDAFETTPSKRYSYMGVGQNPRYRWRGIPP